MVSKKINRNRVHLRQLCCLGLNGEAIMPDILKALHGIIEHHSSIFVFFDETGQPCNLYSDIFIPDIINLYFTEYENLISPHAPDLPAIARHGKPAGNYRHMPKAFYDTDMYNLICRPCNQHFLLDGTVKENGHPQGIVVLYREKSHTQFSQKNEETLVSLLPYLAHGLKHKPAMEAVQKPVDTLSGMIIATPDGRISHISREANEILFWANQYSFKPGSRMAVVETLSSQVKYLCRCLTNIFNARHAPPPMLEINHHGGRVDLRAYWLENVTGSGQQLVNIMVTWQKPLQLAMMERLREMPLSPKQKEISLMIGLGRNSHQISSSLGISQTTYKDHLQKIYRKLGVRTRDELVALLLHPLH